MPYSTGKTYRLKRTRIRILLSLLLGAAALAIATPYTEVEHPQVRKLPFNGKQFTTDNLGNVFLVQQDNSIDKYDSKGVKQTTENFKIYGDLTHLDVSNPFELYAFYKDQQTLLILDNMFNIRSEIVMNDLTPGEVSVAGRSFDNGIWYFDASSKRLLKADKNLQKRIEGVPLATFTTENWQPQHLLDNEFQVVTYDSSNGFCLFDVFGNYYKTLDIKGLSDFQLKDSKLYYFQNSNLIRYDYKLFKTDTLATVPDAINARIEAKATYIWANDTIYIKPNK